MAARRSGQLGAEPITNNLSSHEVAGVREAIEAVGATSRYLPPCSPDLNPIEKFLAKLKALLGRAAARKAQALWEPVGHLLDHFLPHECRHLLQTRRIRKLINRKRPGQRKDNCLWPGQCSSEARCKHAWLNHQ
ncbi:transposase [Ottowia sp.]|uniref:transposase n=1 Tax=Ottowia sp. TaxID=1898956 RepID=UPI0039E442A1